MIELIQDIWDDGWFGRTMLAMLVLLLTLIPICIVAGVQEEKRWNAFQKEHKCKVVGRMSGGVLTGVGTGIGSNGQVGTIVTTTVEPDKTGWLCDDGVTYWR